jgi:hypothetical protein
MQPAQNRSFLLSFPMAQEQNGQSSAQLVLSPTRHFYLHALKGKRSCSEANPGKLGFTYHSFVDIETCNTHTRFPLITSGQ